VEIVAPRPINRGMLRLALHHLREIKAWHAQYEADVEDWYRRGPGRSPRWITEMTDDGEPYQINVGGDGHTYPSCIHGASRWTDYDNICGPCEDGLSVYQLALYAAHSDWHTWTERNAVVRHAHEVHAPTHIVKELQDWALDAMGVMTRTPRPVRNLP
jgi:hypothetical protein